MPFSINLWSAQNHVYAMRSSFLPKMRRKALKDSRAKAWMEEFLGLCEQLTIRASPVNLRRPSQRPQTERSNFDVLCPAASSHRIRTEPSGPGRILNSQISTRYGRRPTLLAVSVREIHSPGAARLAASFGDLTLPSSTNNSRPDCGSRTLRMIKAEP